MPHVLIKYAHMHICAGEGSQHFSAISFIIHDQLLIRMHPAHHNITIAMEDMIVVCDAVNQEWLHGVQKVLEFSAMITRTR